MLERGENAAGSCQFLSDSRKKKKSSAVFENVAQRCGMLKHIHVPGGDVPIGLSDRKSNI